MRRFIAPICFAIALAVPTAALAYVGPGGGLSLLGALWALLAALATAFLFVIAWPIRKALRRRRTQREPEATEKHANPGHFASEGSKDEPGS